MSHHEITQPCWHHLLTLLGYPGCNHTIMLAVVVALLNNVNPLLSLKVKCMPALTLAMCMLDSYPGGYEKCVGNTKTITQKLDDYYYYNTNKSSVPVWFFLSLAFFTWQTS